MSTVLRPCLECGEPTRSTRCTEHAAPDRKLSARARGYDTAHDKLSRLARKLQPFCLDCGRPDDLQLHHLPIAWERKEAGQRIRLVDVEVLCGQCNRDRGPARTRGGTPTRPSPGPVTQPNTALHTPTPVGYRHD